MNRLAGKILVKQIAPRIRSALPNAVPRVGAEDVAELVQDALAMAARILASATARGRAVSPGNVAYFAIGLAKAGRRSTGTSKTDALAPGTQLRGRSHVCSLEEPLYSAAGMEPLTLGEVLASEAEDPSVTAARNLDWQAFADTLDEMGRAILECMA